MSSTRAGSIPGTHQIGFDAPTETVTLTHTVRDRAVFAHGALEAAKWIKGKRGWFAMDDLINALVTGPGSKFPVRGSRVRGRSMNLNLEPGTRTLNGNRNPLRRIMRSEFTGVGTALITPFTKSGALDEAAVRKLAQRQVDAGIHFLVPCGTTGETPTLTPAERRRIVEICVEEAAGPRAGAGRRGRLRHARESSTRPSKMQKAGAQGLLSVTPYYNQPTPEGLYRALQGDRRQHAAADHRVQRARPDRLQRRSGDAGPALVDQEHRGREGSVRQRDADGGDLPRACRRTSSCCPETMR